MQHFESTFLPVQYYATACINGGLCVCYVYMSVTSLCSTEMAECKQCHTVAHDS